jgi:hypothetical protein
MFTQFSGYTQAKIALIEWAISCFCYISVFTKQCLQSLMGNAWLEAYYRATCKPMQVSGISDDMYCSYYKAMTLKMPVNYKDITAF